MLKAGDGLECDWQLALSEPGVWTCPADCAAASWHRAIVPGTAAAALEQLGFWDRRAPQPLHDKDIWYRGTLDGTGSTTLVFEGLATVAEIWLDATLLARSDNMFATLEVPVTLFGCHRLSLAFRSLSAHLGECKGVRARWRTKLIAEPRLRFVRTTFLGHAPSLSAPIHAVGPWRPIRLRRPEAPVIHALRCAVVGRDGSVSVDLDLPGASPGLYPSLELAGVTSSLVPDGTGGWRGTLKVPDVELWWPRTHGDPHLHDLTLVIGTERRLLRRIGFRTLTIARGTSGTDFRLHVNGVPIFCRGVCWTPDPVTLGSGRHDVEPTLRRLAEANVNMIRVGGTMVYEAAAFHALCDELGILVWQDCMLANVDYPRDDAFAANVLAEVRALLDRTAGSPSLVVLCGGSEIAQQASMMGLPPDTAAHPLFDTLLPALLAAERPDVAYVPGSPSGGALPFVADHGPSHYYGVGAYRRPLEDARRAGVRFASECLAFSNVPDDASLREAGLDPVADPERWDRSVPRDTGADWSFEDTRHHYMALLHGVDPLALRQSDPQRYLDLARATVAEVTERTFDEWRRPGSPTGGGLVWFARDMTEGSGWGVIDAAGRPKSTLHAMRRAFAPLRLLIIDEGVNGLFVHCLNDGAAGVAGQLSLDCLRHGKQRVMGGRRMVVVPARGHVTFSAFELFGCFFDAGLAYRFGAPGHDVVQAVLEIGDGPTLYAHLFPGEERGARHGEAPTIRLEHDDGGPVLTLTAKRTLRMVTIDDAALVPDDNGFTLMPGVPRRVRLDPLPGRTPVAPMGQVRAIDLHAPISYG